MADERMEHDWKGSLVPVADPQTPVRHWGIEMPDGRLLVNRGWREFLAMAFDEIEAALDGADDEELTDGIKFTIRVEDVRREDVCHDD